MRRLGDTISRLDALRRPPSSESGGSDRGDRLTDLSGFGSNPGALRARFYVPAALPKNAALVVVLHGCTQNAAGYDRGSGWSQLADENGFALLFPEQQRANNANLCFNWFNPQDARRESGESLSIRQMVAAMVAAHHLDPARVFVTGLSAGGAMTSVMLATYPEVFAGGAIIAGLPFGTASNVPEAFDRMRGHGGPAGAVLGDLVRSASRHSGPWPSVSVWHGSSDTTVSAGNADAIVEQWRQVHGVAAQPAESHVVDGHPRQVWRDRNGRAVIEEFRIAGMGHGTPLSTSDPEGCGLASPFMLEAGISSAHHIARFWGLLKDAKLQARPVRRRDPAAETEHAAGVQSTRDDSLRGRSPSSHGGVARVIEDALRAAGLMR